MVIGMLNSLKKYSNSLLNLVYPETCLACAKELTSHENELCIFCESNLSYTNFEKFEEATSFDKLFWGRKKLEFTYALLFFEKDESSQHLLFNLKYKNNPQIGVYYGKQIALRILNKLDHSDALIPVPLHPKKEFMRGYNQSLQLANGIAEASKIKVDDQLIKRNKNTKTQTHKNRFERWDNVNGVFSINSKKLKEYKHITLVDDVVTTGSTLENIMEAILSIHPEIKISVVTLAIA